MITVACVRVGDKYGPEYVDKLESMVARHTTKPFKFVCYEESRLPGWWAKLDLFPPRERTLFFDLDTVIVGNIDVLFEYNGPFAIIKDWWNHSFNSSVMSIAPGYGKQIRRMFDMKYAEQFHGDQEWITEILGGKADLWQNIAPGCIGSYKADDLKDGPRDFRVVCFHGSPKPHEIEEGWVREAWV